MYVTKKGKEQITVLEYERVKHEFLKSKYSDFAKKIFSVKKWKMYSGNIRVYHWTLYTY